MNINPVRMLLADGLRRGLSMRVAPGRQERLAGLFVVVGSAIVFGAAIWLLQRWSEAVAHDPADVWGARWLGEHLTAHPFLTAGVVFLSIVLSSGMVMLILVSLARRLAVRFTEPGRSSASGSREKDSGA
jgi:hypothetical protein